MTGPTIRRVRHLSMTLIAIFSVRLGIEGGVAIDNQ